MNCPKCGKLILEPGVSYGINPDAVCKCPATNSIIEKKPNEQYEFIDIYRNGDIITYLAKDFHKLGENATPLRIIQNPSSAEPTIELRLQDIDGVRFYDQKGTL